MEGRYFSCYYVWPPLLFKFLMTKYYRLLSSVTSLTLIFSFTGTQYRFFKTDKVRSFWIYFHCLAGTQQLHTLHHHPLSPIYVPGLYSISYEIINNKYNELLVSDGHPDLCSLFSRNAAVTPPPPPPPAPIHVPVLYSILYEIINN